MVPIGSYWTDVGGASDAIYVVQTNARVIERCVSHDHRPRRPSARPHVRLGHYGLCVAEQWGRRWITIDTSRVAVALARQRILTAKFDYYETADGSNNIGGAGFQYKTVPAHYAWGALPRTWLSIPIFATWEPVLDQKLDALDDALVAEVGDDTRAKLFWQSWGPSALGVAPRSATRTSGVWTCPKKNGSTGMSRSTLTRTGPMLSRSG